NTLYTVSGLEAAASSPWTDVQGVVAGWALVVVYSHDVEPYRYTRVYDGLAAFRYGTTAVTQTGFRVPEGEVEGKVTTVTWEGDNGFAGESLTFDGEPLQNDCDPINNSFNSSWYGPDL